jgi:hemoglobin-like flavoprotein
VNASQIALVQKSFEKVMPIADTAASLFYARLFELDPSVEKLFRGDMKQQGRMLMSMIATAVRGLNDTPTLLTVLKALGRRHEGYGVNDGHYDTVGKSLLWTLEHGLGPDFTPDVRDAWVAAYTLMARTMQGAAREIREAQAVAA